MSEHHEPWPAGTPCWVELAASDPAAAGDFYAELFGWVVEDQGEEFAHYRIARMNGLRVAGIGSTATDASSPSTPPAWTTTIATDDIDKTAEQITAAGGTVFPPWRMGDVGAGTKAVDPTGATFGLWESGAMVGSELANEPGSFTWNECMTRDYDAAKTFYVSVFGYGIFDMSGDGFTYSAITLADRPVGGLGQMPDMMPAEIPASWTTYFKVADCDASAAKVVELGGSILREPWDTPFGRMAAVLDTQGAGFSLMADTAESLANAAQ